MSNYPPGVTGNEFEIAGYDSVGVENVECSKCEWTGKEDVGWYHGLGSWRCEQCNTDNEIYPLERDDY